MPDLRIGEKTIRDLKKFRRNLDSEARNGTGPFRETYRRWGEIYRGFLQLRFSRLSRGGGEWPPLAPRTIARKGHSRILFDTNTLYEALNPRLTNRPGQYQRNIPYGIHVSIRGGSHPKAKVSIGDLARFHQQGAGNNPKRTIIVGPTDTVNSMLRHAMSVAMESKVKRENSITARLTRFVRSFGRFRR